MMCPKCGSHDAYTCETAYDQGSSHGSYAGGQSSWGYNGGSSGTHSGTISTRTGFARRAAPPTTGLGSAFTMIVVAGVLAAIFRASPVGQVAFLFAVLGVLLFVYRLVRLPRYFRRMRAWRASWICGRCSTIWRPHPDDALPFAD